jgi:hypothetical protein
MHVCHHCGAPVEVDEPLARDRECPSCRGDLRACVNCRHYDPRLHNHCRETEAEQIEDRARRNFCEFFSYRTDAFTPAGGSAREAQAREKLAGLFGGAPPAAPKGREALEKLFGGGATAPADRASEARKKLDGLFRKPEPDPDE